MSSATARSVKASRARRTQVFVTLQDRGAIESFRTELPWRETGQ
jgi:hypothetical protein